MSLNRRCIVFFNRVSFYLQRRIRHCNPSEWKKAVVVPIPKPGKDPLLPKHYRPISLTSCLGKLLEKLVNRRLQSFLESNDTLVSYQTGFRQGRSTIDHLVKLSDNILRAFDNREFVAVLPKYNLRGNLPKFVRSFLQDRRFVVRVGNTYSQEYILENGVPQGSTLSCSLFAIAINQIASRVAEEVDKCLYVDDLMICLAGKTVGTVV
uniref:Reverse transcriptase domain-containing protein n=1 Tax=Photinus pyralis TaxID=7054 RepID=A0A1Y1M3K6_PHOPY